MNVEIAGNIIRYLLRDAYFINGTAYAGKSTAVRLLAEKHGGVCCGENYHDCLMDAIDKDSQPNLSYIKNLRDWQAFISRTPDEYDAWITGTAREAESLEIARLLQLTSLHQKLFVDTNISIETLRIISEPSRVALMLAPQSVSVDRFFDRDDPDKQFILSQLRRAEDPEKAMRNYRACLEKINGEDKYEAFAASGFFTVIRDDARSAEETLKILEEHFCLN